MDFIATGWLGLIAALLVFYGFCSSILDITKIVGAQ